MGIMLEPEDLIIKRPKKPKLPRKRKKACIKAQGRKSYYDTIRLAKLTGESPCKFWVNSSVRNVSVQIKGVVMPVPMPTKFW